MLTKKYAPKKIDDVIGNNEVKDKARTWILQWMRGQKQRAILLCGKTGIGKTSLAHAIAHEYDLHLLEISSNELRDKEKIEKIVGSPSGMTTLFSRQNFILIDDMDSLSSKDRGCATALSAILEDPKNPIIITANDAWDKKLASLRNLCTILEMKAIPSSVIFNYLKIIAKKENFSYADALLEDISKKCQGDLRSAINDLQASSSSFRDRKVNIFDFMKSVFKETEIKKIRAAQGNADVDLNTIKLWVSENIALEYEKPREIADAYSFLSKADVFDGRIIKRQYWGFLRYSSILMSAGVSSAKEKPYSKFSKYKFPSYLSQMSVTAKKRALAKSICKKIAKKTHQSSAFVRENLFLYSLMSRHSEENFSSYYRLEEDEKGFLDSLTEKIETPAPKKAKSKA